jgi:hypothetical protein
MILANLIRTKASKKGGRKMYQANSEIGRPSFWQMVFAQSKVNGALYHGDNLPGRSWEWPKDTYLQRRLQQSKWFQTTTNAKMN